MDDIKNNNQIQESKESKESFINKKNSIIAIGALIIGACLIAAYLRGFTGSEATTSLNNNPDVLIFKEMYGHNIYSVNAKKKKNVLEASVVFSKTAEVSLHDDTMIFQDGEHVYFQDQENSIRKVKITGGLSEIVSKGSDLLPGFSLELNRNGTRIYYQKKSSSATPTLYLNESGKEGVAPHPLICSENETPKLLFKSKDKLFYICINAILSHVKVHYQNEQGSCTALQNTKIHSTETLLVSPDDNHFIIYSGVYLKVKKLSDEAKKSESVNFDDVLDRILNVAFSNDGKTLYVLGAKRDTRRLIEFDYEHLAEVSAIDLKNQKIRMPTID